MWFTTSNQNGREFPLLDIQLGKTEKPSSRFCIQFWSVKIQNAWRMKLCQLSDKVRTQAPKTAGVHYVILGLVSQGPIKLIPDL